MYGQSQKWIPNGRFTQYQGLLLENPHITLQTVQALSPATYLLTADGEPEHNCLEIITEVYATCPDLKDSPLTNADHTLYTDGSSFLSNGSRKAGYVVTIAMKVLEAKALPAQRAEL